MKDLLDKWKSWLRGWDSRLPGGKKIAVLAVSAMTLVTLLLRVLLTPRTQDVETGQFHLSYMVIAVMLLTLLAALVLVLLAPSRRAPLTGKLLMPTAMAAGLAGTMMVVINAVDGVNWLTKGRTPAPNEMVISSIDAFTLFFTIVFGLVGGAFLVRLALQWMQDSRSRSGVMRLWALAPVGWVWMRLARYEVSYASAVDVSESFYDFVMLIFTLLFFFAFARYVSGIGDGKNRLLFFFSLATALFSLSGPLTRVFFYMAGQNDAYNASRLAGVTDGFVGAFALLLAFGLAFCRSEPPAAPSDIETPPEETEPFAGSVDDILQSIYPKDE